MSRAHRVPRDSLVDSDSKSRRKVMKKFISPLLALVTTLSLATSRASAQDEIVIGHFGSLTGGTATFGISTKEGIDLAIKQINEAGGVLGKKVRVVHEDTQSRPEEAVTAVQK